MLSRRRTVGFAKLVLGVMLFSQAAMGFAGCDWLESSPDRAVLAAAEVAPCHESGFGGACLTHCLADRQTVQKVSTDIPAMPAAPVLTLIPQAELLRFFSVAFLHDDAPATGPPRRILLQSFQV